MNIIPIAIAAGGFAIYQLFISSSKPKVQSLRRIDGSGTPVQVVVPVTSTKPTLGKTIVPPIKPSVTTTYTPPPPAPQIPVTIPQVITPTGNTSLSIQTNQDIQRALNTLNMASPPLVVDGSIGPLSIAAIKAFQNANGLSVDGIAGPQTKAALQAAIGSMAATGQAIGLHPAVLSAITQPISLNLTSGVTVITSKDVQHALNMLGASPILVEDGKIGPLSIAAIKAFQISHGLTADGIAGPQTKAALALALSSIGPAPNITDIQPMGEISHVDNVSKQGKQLKHLT
jgi:peptidoglycan hydrolase-like protein with peptidoglycan-binding domain